LQRSAKEWSPPFILHCKCIPNAKYFCMVWWKEKTITMLQFSL
jgi:hypothetical protein